MFIYGVETIVFFTLYLNVTDCLFISGGNLIHNTPSVQFSPFWHFLSLRNKCTLCMETCTVCMDVTVQTEPTTFLLIKQTVYIMKYLKFTENGRGWKFLKYIFAKYL